jgi:hypothetical protein
MPSREVLEIDSMGESPIVLSLLGAFFVYLAFQFFSRETASSLPGPDGWPIIGNLLDLNVEYLYVTCNEWKKQYGSSKFGNKHCSFGD